MLEFKPESDALLGKTILVTGAGDGIGKAAAKSFAQCGADLIILGRTVKKLEQTYDEVVAIHKQAGYKEATCDIVPLDMQGATQKHYQDMALTIEQQFGKLDGLLHNASVLGHLQPFKQISEQEYNEVMQVNVTSHFLMTQALLPVLQKAENASVVFTTSTVGSQGRAYWGTYAMSKFAIEGMMQVLADEYANQNIRFNCINPGRTRTKMRASAYPAENADQLRTPEQIMPTYLYLMSDASLAENGKTFLAQPDLAK